MPSVPRFRTKESKAFLDLEEESAAKTFLADMGSIVVHTLRQVSYRFNS